MTNEAREELENLLNEFEGNMFGLSEEYYNHGICYSCGNVQSGVETDAEGYECGECGEHTVGGIELAMVNLI
jgi:predicted RNA-binding Zn-ribbon protein involved in translation (DUF1610 family)